MDQLEAEILVDELGRLWADWIPTAEQKPAWVGLFAPYTVQTARKAIRAAWQNSKGRKPTPGAVKAELLVLHSRTLAEHRPCKGPWQSGWFVQCVEAPVKSPGRLGWYVSVVFRHIVNGQAEMQSEDALRGAAELMRKAHENLYGGKWETFQKTNHQQMEAQRQRLRAEKSE